MKYELLHSGYVTVSGGTPAFNKLFFIFLELKNDGHAVQLWYNRGSLHVQHFLTCQKCKETKH